MTGFRSSLGLKFLPICPIYEGHLLEVLQSSPPLASQYFGPEYVQIIFSHCLKKHLARETDQF